MLRAMDLGQRKVNKELMSLDLGQRKVKKKLMSWDLGQRKVKKAEGIRSGSKEGKKKS